MNKVPSNQEVIVKKYIEGHTLESATAESHCEFIRNNCCVGFNGAWEVYGIEVESGILSVSIEPAR
jgi:hypothetical protein